MTAPEPASVMEKPGAFSLALNALPCLLVGAGLALAFSAFDSTAGRFAMFAAWIYLLPPLAARVLIAVFGLPTGRLTQDMRAYKVWFVLTQLQMLFNRVALLEELLRLVPGLFALWIRLWGGRISHMAFIGPGVVITDRHLVCVERGAMLGLHSGLAGHMVVRDAVGRFVVVVAEPKVGAEAILGGFAGLGPGASLQSCATLPTGRKLGPFGVWPRP